MPASDGLRAALTRTLGALGPGDRLVVLGLDGVGIGGVELRRTSAGIVEGAALPPGPHEPSPEVTAALDRAGAVHLVRCDGSPAAATALDRLLSHRGDAETVDAPGADVVAEVRAAIADEPLRYLHELVTVQVAPDGRLSLGTQPLFAQDTVRGLAVPISVRIAPGNPDGTAFALVCQVETRLRLVSVQRLRLPPGDHELMVELRGPGRVRILGAAERPEPDHRPWEEICGTLPPVLAEPRPAHLVCAIEDGPGSPARISRVRDLVAETLAEGAGRDVRVSLVRYGPHTRDPRSADPGAEVLLWEGGPRDALDALRDLAGKGPADLGYHRCAQVECALTLVRAHARRGLPPTALLVAGDRPAHPDRTAPHERFVCPRRTDWQPLIRAFEAEGTRLGALVGAAPRQAEPFWRTLGRDVLATTDTADMRAVGRSLGVLEDGPRRVPFPIVVTAPE
ncbi:hypothetical protein LO762_29520 [Actinocorallia sp. API 0066]|uniref:hypothetical protein n=1 Tax=Actinocorallia sp. API 0066 TaxID=2896846 RepID=UPI001E3990CB|nr:hypothetical protein [Actinocorallia sp. API 0066]MCD0453291.1 hypothetical protein [Actinocorallia sp. API 0066]